MPRHGCARGLPDYYIDYLVIILQPTVIRRYSLACRTSSLKKMYGLQLVCHHFFAHGSEPVHLLLNSLRRDQCNVL